MQMAVDRYLLSMDHLVSVIQELSLARDLDSVMRIVRAAARRLTGADGATFVLRDRDLCYYADEDAIAPLWKGKRFPMSACISGWAMLNRRSVAIEDIYSDPRVPADAYRPTFVKSLAMVPIRTREPIGAIGNYWAEPHRATAEELKLLQALADSASIALDNVQLYGELERRVRDRTAALEAANEELEAFSAAVSHDLRAPLRAIDGFSEAVLEDYAPKLDSQGRDFLERIRESCARMGRLIEDLLNLSRVGRQPLRREPIDLASIGQAVVARLRAREPSRAVQFVVTGALPVEGDPGLLETALENLLGNAWKFTGKIPRAVIELGTAAMQGETVYYVRDNGAGFGPSGAEKLFAPFQRLHSTEDFPGTGVGLATVQRIIRRHGGKIWGESGPAAGATFYFTLPGGER